MRKEKEFKSMSDPWKGMYKVQATKRENLRGSDLIAHALIKAGVACGESIDVIIAKTPKRVYHLMNKIENYDEKEA